MGTVWQCPSSVRFTWGQRGDVLPQSGSCGDSVAVSVVGQVHMGTAWHCASSIGFMWGQRGSVLPQSCSHGDSVVVSFLNQVHVEMVC